MNDISHSKLSAAYFLDGISFILQRVRPAFIFCDADVLETINQIIVDIELDAKFFIVNGTTDGYDSIDTLMQETGEEDGFE